MQNKPAPAPPPSDVAIIRLEPPEDGDTPTISASFRKIGLALAGSEDVVRDLRLVAKWLGEMGAEDIYCSSSVFDYIADHSAGG